MVDFKGKEISVGDRVVKVYKFGNNGAKLVEGIVSKIERNCVYINNESYHGVKSPCVMKLD